MRRGHSRGVPLGEAGKAEAGHRRRRPEGPEARRLGWAAQTRRPEARSRVERRGERQAAERVKEGCYVLRGIERFLPVWSTDRLFHVRTARDRVLDVEAEASQDRRRGRS